MKITNLKAKIWVTVAVLLFAFLLYLSPVHCPIYSLLHVKCPGCGMTRAVLSAMRFEFAKAFSHHYMFWSLPILYVGFLYDGSLFKSKYANALLWTLIALGFVLNWVCNPL